MNQQTYKIELSRLMRGKARTQCYLWVSCAMVLCAILLLNPQQAMAAPASAPAAQMTLPVPPTISVQKQLLPANDPGRFNLQISGSTVAPNVGNGGTVGGTLVAEGSHTISEEAMPGHDLADYDTTIRCVDQADQPIGSITNGTSLTISVAMNQEITCTITNIRKNALKLSKTDNDVLAAPGETILYELGYQNDGSSSLTGVVISETVPEHTTFNPSASTLGWVCDAGMNAGSVCIFEIGTIGAGTSNSAPIVFATTVDSPLTAANVGSINNLAFIRDDIEQHVAIASESTPLLISPRLVATKQDSLVNDADGNGTESAGDTIGYQVRLENNGDAPVSSVVLTDNPDQYTTLSIGSVSTSNGTILIGDSVGDMDVQVDVGTIAAGESVVIDYEVVIDATLPVTVTKLQNQALLTSNEIPTISTDDPDTLAPNDATNTSLSAAPIIVASQTDSLALDNDGDGIPSPGDTIMMEAIISNIGNSAATNVLFSAPLDPNTKILPGSSTTSLGNVNIGNAVGDEQVDVFIGFLPANSSVRIQYHVVINDPLPASVTAIQMQGVISSNQLPNVLTDDLALPANQDPTSVTISAITAMNITKRDLLFVDSDADNVASPGDILFYRVDIVNNGNAASPQLIFEDMPDVYTTLIAGSVQTNQGLIIRGNSTGDSSIEIDLGSVAGGGAAIAITYQVEINSIVPVDQLQTQAQISLVNSSTPFAVSDDPDTAQIGDVTVTFVKGASGSSSIYLPIIDQ